jgi:vacuolar-type H+-ATPase subunit H
MKDDVLGKVVEVEKNIQNKIQSETGKAQEWLEKIKSECDEKISEHESDETSALQETVQHACSELEKKASAIIYEARKKAEQIETLRDDTLKRIIMNHITGILP